jgi:hypothetical protein
MGGQDVLVGRGGKDQLTRRMTALLMTPWMAGVAGTRARPTRAMKSCPASSSPDELRPYELGPNFALHGEVRKPYKPSSRHRSRISRRRC